MNPPATAPLGTLHQRRVHRMLTMGSAVIGVSGVCWCAVFLARGDLVAGLLDAVAAGGAGLAWWLARQGHSRPASWLLIGLVYLLACLCALFLDVPSAQVPRSIHQFLLGLGVVSCLLLRNERPWLRHGVPLLCLVTYAVFAGSDLAVATSLALPDGFRAPGVWLNQAVALAIVYATLQVLQTDMAERTGLEIALRDALVRGELLLHYQPQVGAGSRVVGAEALVRWQHPTRGLVPPGEFIPAAERCGLMPSLGDWVLRAACQQLADWKHQPETALLVLSVNVSASQFAQPDFVDRVLGSLRRAGADPKRLRLELTESMLAHDLEDIIDKMRALKSHGIGFSLDDFGTGFSSLSYLQRLPLDELKIDQSFVRNMLASTNDSAIVRAVITLGRSLGLEVIAEGVETEAQRSFLAGLGCSLFQGYLFGRPVPVADFQTLVARGAAVNDEQAHAVNDGQALRPQRADAVPA